MLDEWIGIGVQLDVSDFLPKERGMFSVLVFSK